MALTMQNTIINIIGYCIGIYNPVGICTCVKFIDLKFYMPKGSYAFQ